MTDWGDAYPSTPFTHMRLLASMHAVVHGERGPLDELLAAARKVADVRPVSAVDSL